MKILILENISKSAFKSFEEAGFSDIDVVDKSLNKKELLEKIADYHVICIRSNTYLDKEVIEKAEKLVAIGCFCIGTNQVDLLSAKSKGIAVFNSPYANTRSVAELVIAEAIFLMRGIITKNSKVHKGVWEKSATDSYEVRNKVFGIIGYGNIGSQIGLLAESMGMKIKFFDLENKLPLGNAFPCSSLEELLSSADVISLHVPKTKETTNLLNDENIGKIKKGSYIINAARGDVVCLESLHKYLKNGHIKGAALDVFPVEPKTREEKFESVLCGMDNVILTPHIGGSTQESQVNIGVDVAVKIIEHLKYGKTSTSVNLPKITSFAKKEGHARIIHTHRNEAGILEKINGIFARNKVNVIGLQLQTDESVGCAIVDIENCNEDILQECKAKLREINNTILVRLIR
jgi:D-3-phosphoglycerate dehydrogenase